jgi:hypothetical protein
MMDENAEDNSRSTTDKKRCHHRMPFHHCSVDGIVNKDNNSFNHRYTIVTVCHSPPFTQQYILIKQHYHRQERMFPTNTYCQPTNSYLITQQYNLQLPRTYIREKLSASSHSQVQLTLHYKSMKQSLKPERNLIENKCNQHTIIPRIIKK